MCIRDRWLINDEDWETYKNTDSRRLVYSYKGNKEVALEVLTRLKPRTIQVSKLDDMNFINFYKPDYEHLISKYVNTIDDESFLRIKNVSRHTIFSQWYEDNLTVNGPDFEKNFSNLKTNYDRGNLDD